MVTQHMHRKFTVSSPAWFDGDQQCRAGWEVVHCASVHCEAAASRHSLPRSLLRSGDQTFPGMLAWRRHFEGDCRMWSCCLFSFYDTETGGLSFEVTGLTVDKPLFQIKVKKLPTWVRGWILNARSTSGASLMTLTSKTLNLWIMSILLGHFIQTSTLSSP